MKVLITQKEIEKRVEELAEEIKRKYKGKELIVLILLKGAFVFAADLLRKLEGVEIRCDFIKASSYGTSTESSGNVQLNLLPSLDITGKEVLLVDDILDTGLTLKKVKDWVLEQGAKSCETCVLLDKPERRKVPFKADYTGFEIPNHFVVGYGMDCAERYRHLPYVAILE